MAGTPLLPADLASAVKSIGRGYVFAGRTDQAGGLSALGITEGEIKVAFNQEFNDLKFPELTGPVIHERKLTGENVVVTIPLILGDLDLFQQLSPVNKQSGGSGRQQPVVTTSLVIFPESEIPEAGLSFTPAAGATPASWTPAAPQRAIWIWRGHFVRPGYNFKQADGGKVIVETTFQAMYDASKPSGHRVYTIGNPAGIEGITLAI